jgi:hypothetical protein
MYNEGALRTRTLDALVKFDFDIWINNATKHEELKFF